MMYVHSAARNDNNNNNNNNNNNKVDYSPLGAFQNNLQW